MNSSLRILLFGCLALLAPLALLKMVSGSVADLSGQEQQMERFYQQAERRSLFINGMQQVQGVTMWIADYHFHNYELPDSVQQLRHGLPEIRDDGPDRFSFDAEDASVSMYFEGRSGIADGAITYTPTADDDNETLAWECWTSDYPDIEAMLPGCTFYEP